MKLEAAKHVEVVGAMKLEDKELTGGCNGDSEEEDSNLRETPKAMKVAGGRREIPEAVKVAGGLSALMMEEEPKKPFSDRLWTKGGRWGVIC